MKYSLLFEGQCTVLINKVIETIYDKLEALTYIPLAPAEGEGVERLKWRKYTAVGLAKIISDYATDIPSVEAYGEEVESKVYHVATKFGWSILELKKASRAGVDIIGRKDSAARQAIETEVNRIAWYGDKESKIPGFMNYPGITKHTLADAAAGTKTWAKKTPAEIAQDITDMVTAIGTMTSNKEQPNTCIMPPSLYRMVTTKYVDDRYEVSVLDLIKKNNPMLTTIAPVAELEKANSTHNGGRIMVYDRNSDKLEFHLPVRVQKEDLPQDGLRMQKMLYADVGGTTVYYPQSVCYADGAN